MTARRPRRNGPHPTVEQRPFRCACTTRRSRLPCAPDFGRPTGRSRPSPGASAATLRSCDAGRHPEGHPNPRRPRSATPESAGTTDRPSRLPLGGFTCCLTLSSECFSTFPHGTCSLSVSRQYLALDGVYHPLWAAFPNNPTPGPRRCPRRSLRLQGPDTRYG